MCLAVSVCRSNVILADQHRGTQVKGRLLWPDGTPAAGVHLYAGVYIAVLKRLKLISRDFVSEVSRLEAVMLAL